MLSDDQVDRLVVGLDDLIDRGLLGRDELRTSPTGYSASGRTGPARVPRLRSPATGGTHGAAADSAALPRAATAVLQGVAAASPVLFPHLGSPPRVA